MKNKMFRHSLIEYSVFHNITSFVSMHVLFLQFPSKNC